MTFSPVSKGLADTSLVLDDLLFFLCDLCVLCGEIHFFQEPKGTKVTNPIMKKTIPTTQLTPNSETRSQGV
jgi:hypothetical protein